MKKNLEIFSKLLNDVPTIFIIIPISVLALTAWFFVHLVKIEEDKIKNALGIEAIRIEASLIDSVEHTFAIIKNMNEQIAKDPNNKTYINQIISKFKTSPDLSEAFSWTLFSWANSHHQITVDAKYGVMTEPYDLSNRDYIHLTVDRPDEFHLGNPVLGSTSKKWMIPGGVGAVDSSGKYLGALTIGFEINALARSLRKTLQNNNVGFELVNFKGVTVLYGYNTSFGFSRGIFVDANLIKTMLQKLQDSDEEISIIDISLFKNRHGILVKRIKNYPYYLVLRYDDKMIANGLWSSFISRFVEILILFFTSTLLFVFIYRKKHKEAERLLTVIIEAKHRTSEIKENLQKQVSSSSPENKELLENTLHLVKKIEDNLREIS
ncbi:MAG: hypothetical protein KGQ36_00335 [Rickettsiales bacterium]|nr:hypothetical protein [Rickettsiales bacterium]